MDTLQKGKESNHWDAEALSARIDSSQRQTRFEAGSPNEQETEVYRKALLANVSQGQAIVLGMTPELRKMVLDAGFRLISIDSNRTAHEAFAGWIDPTVAGRETRILGNWFDLPMLLAEPANAILGDGIFGNVLGMDAHRELLEILRGSLRDDGALILRHALAPADLTSGRYAAERLLQQYRAGELSAADFGLTMRLWGSADVAYDPSTGILDNSPVFARYDEWTSEGILTVEERLIIGRYQFAGRNMLLTADAWERLLAEAGFRFTVKRLRGRLWYDYYPIYTCRLSDTV